MTQAPDAHLLRITLGSSYIGEAMYDELSPAERILLAIDFVLNQVDIPTALEELIDDADLIDIRNPETVCH